MSGYNLGMNYESRILIIGIRCRDNPREYARRYYRLTNGKKDIMAHERQRRGDVK